MAQYIKGKITFLSGDVFEFTQDDIYGDVTISSQCVAGNSFSLGSVCSSECTMTFIIENVSRYEMIGAVIEIEISGDLQVWEKLGVYNVISATRRYNNISVNASDNMILLSQDAFTKDENNSKINEIYNFLSTERCIYDVLEYVVETLGGLELAQTKEEFEQLPNGNLTTIVYENPENAYLRDWLSWIAEFVGGFASADENGKIKISILQQASDYSASVTLDEIETDTSDIADFTTNAVKSQMTGYDGAVMGVWNEDSNKTIVIDVSDNLIAQGYYFLLRSSYNDSDVYTKVIEFLGEIYHAIIATWIRPFTANVHSDFLFKAGQSIQIQGLDGVFYPTIITHHVWTLNGGQHIRCIGEDTRLISDTKVRTALKRESEKLQSQINLAKGFDVSKSELEEIIQNNRYAEGQTFFVFEE